jgi:non-specific protein-tyrosine kinase
MQIPPDELFADEPEPALPPAFDDDPPQPAQAARVAAPTPYPARHTMDLHQYLRILYARRYVIAAVVVVAVAVAAAVKLLPAREWAASAALQVQPASALTGGAVRPDDVAYLDRLINTYTELVASSSFEADVARLARLRERPTLTIKAPSNTNLIGLEARAGSAADAARAATVAGHELVARVQQTNDVELRAADKAFEERASAIEGEIARAHVRLVDLRQGVQDHRSRESQVRLQEQIAGQRVSLSSLRNDYEAQRSSQAARASILSVTGEAATPTAPVSRRLNIVLPLGLVFGLLAGCGLALTADNLARRFRSEDEIEAALDTPVLAMVPRSRNDTPHVLFKPGTREHEAVRRVRTQLLLSERRGVRRILVASAEPGEGKSTLAANLAASLADSGRSVILVDADLRRPTVHKFFGERNDRGISTILTGSERATLPQWQQFAVRVGGARDLSIIPAGPTVSDPPTLLDSGAMSRLLDELGLRFHVVIIDSPAILAVSDALVLARDVDAVILVAGSQIAPDALRLANQQLRRAGATPLGLVMNGTDESKVSYYVDYEVTRE